MRCLDVFTRGLPATVGDFSEMYQNIVDLCRDVKRFSTNTKKKKGFQKKLPDLAVK